MQQEDLCPVAADPGQEHGYLVKMTDDTIIPPYQLQPGQNVTLVSRYDSSVDHFGGRGVSYPLMSLNYCIEPTPPIIACTLASNEVQTHCGCGKVKMHHGSCWRRCHGFVHSLACGLGSHLPWHRYNSVIFMAQA